MKRCGQEVKVTLSIHGEVKTFSEQELIDILEKYFSNEAITSTVTEIIAKVPTEEQWFEVNPQAINKSLFENEREDGRQEETRRLILEAFAEVESNPQKYGKKFKTMIPEKNWTYKTAEELRQLACKRGGSVANWVEQALEWAQRICNGESWEAVCNKEDTANWYRMILWKNGYYRLVGGSNNHCYHIPASYVFFHDYASNSKFNYAVPLIVIKN